MFVRGPLSPFVLLALCLSAATGCAGGASGPGGQNGADLWLAQCAACHGAYGQGTDVGPDLRYEVGTLTREQVVDTILDGAGSMDPVDLTVDEAERVADFVIDDLL